MNILISEISRQFLNIHRGRNWFGQSYQIKLQDLDESLCFVQPQPGVHSVAELISHGTAWRKDVITKIQTAKGVLTETSDEDWPDLEKLKATGWDKIHQEYVDSVDSLIRLLEELDDAFLTENYYDPEFGGSYPYSFTIIGIVHHDLYHLGQLGLVIKMLMR